MGHRSRGSIQRFDSLDAMVDRSSRPASVRQPSQRAAADENHHNKNESSQRTVKRAAIAKAVEAALHKQDDRTNILSRATRYATWTDLVFARLLAVKSFRGNTRIAGLREVRREALGTLTTDLGAHTRRYEETERAPAVRNRGGFDGRYPTIPMAQNPGASIDSQRCCIQFRHPRHGVPGRKPLPKVPVNHSKREARPWSRRQISRPAPPLSLHLHITILSGHNVGLLCSRCRHRPELSSASRPVGPSSLRSSVVR